jgi:hypothetical protein
MRRISISTMMAGVAAAAFLSAIVVAALRLESGAVRALTAMLLSIAILTAVRKHGGFRGFCVGFAIVGWAYFLTSCIIPTILPTSHWIMRVYEAMIGSPTAFGPDEVMPWIHQASEFLRIGHAAVSLLIGVVGGVFGLAMATMVSPRSRAIVVVDDRESPISPQDWPSSLES